jgi:hypothetical protein
MHEDKINPDQAIDFHKELLKTVEKAEQKEEKYVLDHGISFDTVLCVDRKKGKVILKKEYYGNKSPKIIKRIDLSTFEEVSKRIIYRSNPYSENLEKEYCGLELPTKEELEEIDRRNRNPSWLWNGRHG